MTDRITRVLKELKDCKLSLEIERNELGRCEEARLISISITNLETSILYLAESNKEQTGLSGRFG